MSKAHPPELKKYMEKVLTLKLNGNRKVTGTLRGFDPFMNLVVDDAVEETKSGEKRNIGMVVIRELHSILQCVKSISSLLFCTTDILFILCDWHVVNNFKLNLSRCLQILMLRTVITFKYYRTKNSV
ncbi:hypothetical protein Btru_059638 [Bulinus truncatus]|nr:hypothetical protein Btru_059638 [Bulinus truncatus]